MSLYLCIFENDLRDEEVAAVEVGPYSYFATFREAVAAEAEHGRWGSRFPTLMNHPDSTGQWSPTEAARLREELVEIRIAFLASGSGPPSVPDHTAGGSDARFVDIEGSSLLDRLIELAEESQRRGLPIWFQ
jgi:Immunity protein 70